MAGLPEETVFFYPGAPPTQDNPDGDVHTGQMYVHFVRLAHPRGAVPIILMHGGGLSGTGWESAPDGRPGWQQFFLQAGFDVLVPDQVERGRSNWSRFPQIFTSAPMFRTSRPAHGMDTSCGQQILSPARTRSRSDWRFSKLIRQVNVTPSEDGNDAAVVADFDDQPPRTATASAQIAAM